MLCGKVHCRDVGPDCDVAATQWPVTSCWQLPDHWILEKLLDETPSDWATATVAEQRLKTPAFGTLPYGWATGGARSPMRAFTQVTAVSTEN
jgi:hypothetical protein